MRQITAFSMYSKNLGVVANANKVWPFKVLIRLCVYEFSTINQELLSVNRDFSIFSSKST